MNPNGKRSVRTRLHSERLEDRENPSSVWSLETFDGTPIGALPAEWRSWSSSGDGAFAVRDQRAYSGPQSLVTATLSSTHARVWSSQQLPADFGLSAYLYLDHLQPVQFFVRGQALDGDRPSYYALAIQRGLQAELLKVVDGGVTSLATRRSTSYTSGIWVRVTLQPAGTNLRVEILRTDANKYLNAAGHWQDARTWALEAADDELVLDGYTGIHRPAQTAAAITIDDVAVLGARRIHESFDSTPLHSIPDGWTQWSTQPGPAFAVTDRLSLSPKQSLQSSAPNTRLGGRAWIPGQLVDNVQVAASIYTDNLNPVELFARGSSLAGDTPTYYALSLTRGVTAKLLRVVNGGVTELASVKSTAYVSDKWIRATLLVNGDQIQASIFRLDTGQYLGANGTWQNSRTRTMTATDAGIASAGLIGVQRPALYATSVTLDDFEMQGVSGDSDAPIVAIRSPAAGATVSDVITVRAEAQDASGVEIVEFLVDGVLRYSTTKTPYDWELNTIGLANGLHTITVRATDVVGNTGQATITVTVANDVPPRPTIPRHYNHIRVAALAYNGTPIGAFERTLLRNSIDLVIPHPRYLATIDAEAPNTPQLIYSNVSNLYEALLTDWLAYADARGLDRESAFYHAAAPSAWTGASSSSMPVEWFWSALRGGNLLALTNLTSAARDTVVGDVTFGGVGEAIYLGFPERFREINVNIFRPASGGWTGALEYAVATDTGGLPTQWKTLAILHDSSAGFTRSGVMTFDPPSDWKTAQLRGSAPLYFVRIRTTAGGTTPIATTLLGRDYVQARKTSSGIVPVFDAAADRDGDGYLHDAEYVRRTSGQDARFRYESRLFYPYYGQMRFVTNPSSRNVQDWAADFHLRFLNSNPHADGLFLDNSGGRPPLSGYRTVENMDDYTVSYSTMLAMVYRKIAPRWLAPNTSGGGLETDAVIVNTPASVEEFAIRPLAHNRQQFEDLAALVAHRRSLTQPPAFMVLDSHPAGGSPIDPRTRISTLAYYYLLADRDTTFLMFYGGNEPATSWTRHWSQAAAYDVGRSISDWSVFAQGLDPTNSKLTYRVYQRGYGNALVLYKPLSYAQGVGSGSLSDATATTHALGAAYRILRDDGTLSSPVSNVTLRNGEGAILIRS